MEVYTSENCELIVIPIVTRPVISSLNGPTFSMKPLYNPLPSDQGIGRFQSVFSGLNYYYWGLNYCLSIFVKNMSNFHSLEIVNRGRPIVILFCFNN